MNEELVEDIRLIISELRAFQLVASPEAIGILSKFRLPSKPTWHCVLGRGNQASPFPSWFATIEANWEVIRLCSISPVIFLTPEVAPVGSMLSNPFVFPHQELA